MTSMNLIKVAKHSNDITPAMTASDANKSSHENKTTHQ